MSKEEMLKKLIENQIERGIVRECDKDYQIRMRMNYSKSSVQSWYNEVFNKVNA